jgi:hypothetical protein
MIDLNVISPSAARYYSQVLLVPKPDNAWRFCIDFRLLNLATLAKKWPLPRIDELLRFIGTTLAIFFSKIDLTSGYHQMPLHEKSREATAFITLDGIFEWLRVAMGLSGSGSHFQHVMTDEVLGPELVRQGVLVYLDDLLTYGKTFEEYLDTLRQVFEKCRSKRITLHPKKCSFGLRKVEFVGHEVTSAGVNMSKAQRDKVLNFERPTSVKKLQSFLGLLNYFRDHIKDYHKVTRDLYQFAAKTVRGNLDWTAPLTEQFYTAKHVVDELPTLYFLQDEGEVHVYTDASDYGIGASIEQWVNGKKLPIQFISKTLTPVQQRWGTIEKECYAIVYTCKTLWWLLRDNHFYLHTDHKNLTYIKVDVSSKVYRWKLFLQQFDFTPVYVKGEDNIVADAFSRLCSVQEDEEVISPLGDGEIVDVQPTDDEFKLISSTHNAVMGHHGVNRTYELMRRNDIGSSIIHLREKISWFIKRCDCCQRMSVITPVVTTRKFTTATYKPMVRLNIDTVGPLRESPNGNKFILVIIDTFTRWVELFPIKDTSAIAAAEALLQHSGRYGFAQEILSDKGSQFVNQIISELSKLMLADFEIIMAYSKEENAIVERANKEVIRHTAAIMIHPKMKENWDRAIPFVQRIINSSVHSATGVSPAKLLYGNAIDLDEAILHPDKVKEPKQFEDYSEYVQDLITTQRDVIEIAAVSQRKKDQKHIHNNNVEVNDTPIYPIGSWVLVKLPKGRMHTIGEHKLDNFHWKGPFKIESYNGDKYEIFDPSSGHFMMTHVTWLKPYLYHNIDPVDVAIKNNNMYIVEKVVKHEGNFNQRTTLSFLIHWKDTNSEEDTWEPWSSFRSNEVVHDYLRSINKSSLIPARFRTKEDDIPKVQTPPAANWKRVKRPRTPKSPRWRRV